MNVVDVQRAPSSAVKSAIVDCDIHPLPHGPKSLHPYLASRWQRHLENFGGHLKQPFAYATQYPRTAPLICRRDAWPPSGGPPGSDLDFMRFQHLDPFNIAIGILIPLFGNVASERNQEYGAALARAINDWQVEQWLDRESRLRGTIVVAQDDPEASVAEIERCSKDRRFVQVMLAPRSSEPLGRRRYWPIFEAAERLGLPIGIHTYGIGGHPSTGGGWPSFYIEEHYATTTGGPAVVTSMVMEGVFQRFALLRTVLIEIGFAWAPSYASRLDRLWSRMKDEVADLKQAPSTYMRNNLWYTTQPMEEPAHPEHLRRTFDAVGWDRLLFSSDYPHWDQDDPSYAFPIKLTPSERAKLCRGNAEQVYRLWS
jgi:uncharacterized protein